MRALKYLCHTFKETKSEVQPSFTSRRREGETVSLKVWQRYFIKFMQRKQYEKEIEPRDASQLNVGIVVARFNSDITESMLQGALELLREWRVVEKNIYVLHVPGSFEIPFGCLTLLTRHKLDAIVTIGCIIKGETDHNKYLAAATTEGIMRVSLDHHMPISLGVITTNNLKQAQVRSSGKTNKGREAAIAALELAML